MPSVPIRSLALDLRGDEISMNKVIRSDFKETVRVSSNRFEMSPFAPFYVDADTAYGVYAGRFSARSDEDDVIAAYWNLRRKVVLYDVPEKPWQIEGPDALPFLEKLFARRVGNLLEGRGRYAIACTHEGGIFMDGILFKLSENCYWYVQADGDFETWLLAHKAGFDVKVSDPKSRVLQVQGPNSMNVMSDISNGAINESMKYFHSGYYDIGGQELYVSRTGWTGEMGYEIYSVGSTDHKLLWDNLLEAGDPHGMFFANTGSMAVRRIESGILDNLSDFDVTMNPFQAGLGAFVDLDKEGFVGRDSLLSADKTTLLYGIKCNSMIPEENFEVLGSSDCVAHVTTGAWSPFLEIGIGYARFQQPGDWVGRTLTIKNDKGETSSCEVVALPFYDADKRIPRGMGEAV